jgi:hypothetical protein
VIARDGVRVIMSGDGRHRGYPVTVDAAKRGSGEQRLRSARRAAKVASDALRGLHDHPRSEAAAARIVEGQDELVAMEEGVALLEDDLSREYPDSDTTRT